VIRATALVSATTPGDQLGEKMRKKAQPREDGLLDFFSAILTIAILSFTTGSVVLVHGEIAAHSAVTRAATRDQGTSSVRSFSTTPRS
jgi:hypothetical protein